MPQQIGNPQPGSQRFGVRTENIRAAAERITAWIGGESPGAAVNMGFLF